MDFLIYSRASAHAMEADDDPDLDERHWAYIDRWADGLTARGPVLSADRQSWNGSIHVLDLPSTEAAREFITNEPYQQAGAYREHSVWRFTNLIGRTMWDFRQPCDGPLFCTLLRPEDSAAADIESMGPPSEVARDLVVCGMIEDVDAAPSAGTGVVLAAPASNRHAADALFDRAFPSLTGRLRDVLDWRFGGRR